MSTVLNAIYDYRTEDDFDPSKLFHRKVNKRVIPEYYETIKEPMAMSTIKQKIHTRAYHSFKEFVRDFALIPYNAQVFNVPDSGAFQDALIIKEQLEKQLQLLVKDGVITQEVATLPDLGEIPTYENTGGDEKGGDGEDDEESDEEGEEDEDEDGDEEEDGKKRRRRGRPSKRDTIEDGDGKRARGRPPKLLTPLEARIQAILKGLRKPKDENGQLLIANFDRLPDKAAMPEYFAEIKNPMAYDGLKRKAKRKKYKTLEDFMADVNLIFSNAKQYNTDESQIYKDAVKLQIEAGRLYDEERAKPDDSFADDEGKIPLPNGVFHNGESYKVGDWVHIQNPNDLTKPIPAQVYRTYRDSSGQQMVNVCWYYRPEQTIHRYDKHFYQNEVVKTGRYRDHRAEEIEGKCFIMFYTRFFKGRPRGLPAGAEVYVCQARYNEAQPQFNTIKTWASCLPDEVRDKDYEMDLFDHPRKMKKFPSPIAYLLKDDQKETDDFPKAQWGAEGAPPKIGAVHRRPRTEKDSPPPEPTPPPPPKMPTPPPRQAPPTPNVYAPTPTQQHDSQASSSGAPNANTPSRPASSAQAGPSPAPQRPLSVQPTNYRPTTPQAPQTAPPNRPTGPAHQSSYGSNSSHHGTPGPSASTPYPPRPGSAVNYRDPPPIEVYTLPDIANLSIPAEIRAQYQCDPAGRVLFFATPPAGSTPGAAKLPGHSARYLAEKARRADVLAAKHRALADQRALDERAAKRARVESLQKVERQREESALAALQELDSHLADSVAGQLSSQEQRLLRAAQETAGQREAILQENARKRKQERAMRLVAGTVGVDNAFADDWDSHGL